MRRRSLRTLTTLALLVAATTTVSADSAAVDAARAWREVHAAEILDRFAELLALPNVASDEDGIRANAEWIREALETRGVAADIWTLPGAPPVVYGRREAAGAERTLGIYVHYDGQPVDASLWAQPPWQPTLYSAALEAGGTPIDWPEPGEAIDPEWRIYGRSSGDDKAPLPAVFSALDALAAAGIEPTSDLVFLFEGEEEAGSDHLGQYLAEHRELLGVHVWLICDGPVHQSRRPQLVFGVRGYTGFDLTVYGATRYLHSGHYGNWAPNPALELARLLAGMKDADGRVLIEGFYDSTAPVGDAERRAMASLPDYDDRLRRELGLAATEAGDAPLAERLLIPSLNIRGMASAAVGGSARNIVPTEAVASLDVRLAEGNDPVAMLDLVEAHIEREGWHIVREEPSLESRLAHPRIVRVDRREGYPAARTPLDHPLVEEIVAAAELAAASAAAEGPVVLLPTMGGSLPLHLFTDVLAAPVIITPIANHDDNQHAPNENLRLANLWYGIDLMAALFTLPDTTRPEDPPAVVAPVDPELERLADWLTGSFSSAAQAAGEPDDYYDIRLEMARIWPERSDGPWLYVEQAAATALDRPYRQRVYRLGITGDGVFTSEVYALPGDPLAWAGAFDDERPLADLQADSLVPREGCTIHLRAVGRDTFAGATRGAECASTLRGASYATSEVVLGPETLFSWDRGYDADDRQVWGAEKGAYRFDRIAVPGTRDP